MASGASSLESNGSNESISHDYVTNERHNPPQLPTIPIPIEYDSLSPGQCYEGQNYTVKGHGMSAPYDSLPYDLLKQQTNESLKQQCDKAYQELNQLRRQNSETSRRCDHVMKELEYFRGQHRAAMSQLEASAQEANSLRGKYGDLLNDNQRLEREVAALAGGPGGAGGADAFAHSLRNYDALKEDCAVFQKRYDELIENHEATQEQLRIVQEENSRLTTQCHELTQERNAVIRERNALKAQAAALSRGAGAAAWDASRLPHPHPAADVKRLTDERNAALAEYTLIMSERDTVHKEMEKLADDLQAALKRVAALEAALQAARDQNRAEALQAESLRLEIESALAERDRAVKECCDLKAPAANANRTDNAGYHLSSGGNDGFINGQSNDPELDKMQGLPGGGSGSGDAGGAEPDAAEAARLRALTERLRADLARTTREAEVSKRRRDWAFSERDKLLQERESVKALCNRLRKERDQMVSELAEARRQPGRRDRDRDRDRRSPRPPQVLPHEFHACDLLVDEEDYEWDTIEVELNGLGKDGDLGFELSGGLDEPYYHGDTALYVTSVKKGSVLEGKINILDRVTEAVGVSSWQSGGAAAAAVRAALARGPAALRLQRARYRRRRIAVGDTRGLALAHGIFVSKIACGSAAAKDGNLCVGDRIASINNRSLEGVKSVSEAMACLNDCQYDAATLTVLRPLFPCCDHRDSTRCADCESRSRRGHGGPGSGSGSGAGSRSRDSAEGPDRDDDPTPQFDRECFQVPFNRKVLPRGQYYSPAPPPVEKSTHPANMHPGYKVQKHEYIDFLTNTGGKLPSEPPLMSPFDNRYVYHLAASSQGKIHQERGTWDMIRGKIEAVTGRSKSKDKQNKVPESDAIAELDSVIDSYHGKTIKETSSVLKRSRRKNKESQNDSKNGGTWPKARANFILEENSTGTIVQPRARKERPPLSILLSPPTKLPPEPQRSNTNRNSNPIPLGHAPLTQVTAPARHSVYKSIETPAIEHFPKPAPLAIHNPFASPSNFDKIRTLEKDKMSISDYSDHDITPNRLSLVLNPSDDSLDYQPVTRNRNKSPHSLDFIVNKGPSSLDFVTRKSPSSLDHSIKNHPGKDILEQYYSKKSTSPKTVNKYPSDSDSFGPDSLTGNFPMAGTLPTAARLQYYRGPFANANPHPRYPAPAADTPQSRSGESLGGPYDMHFPTHAHNMSDLQPDRAPHHSYEGGTFPRKKENQRFRVPSNPSVTSKNSAGKLSTGSIERADRGSPTPIFHVEVLSPGRAAKAIKPRPPAPPTAPAAAPLGRPLPGELRRIHIDKSQQPLGIQINCPGSSGGVFVSTVYDNSLASKVGLQVGDQLLDVCGINMRTATYTLAASVLRQIGNSISMLVQYSPEKYRDELARGGTSSSSSDEDGDDADGDADAASLSGSATPRNSPGPQQGRLGPTGAPMPGAPPAAGPRYLLIEVRNCADLGISLVGGNAVGIFVHSVGKDSPAHKAGLRTGDQILEFNNADLRRATAEQAALELAKPSEAKISVLVRHDLQQYHDIKDKPGDAFYIRAGFDRSAKITSIGLDVIDGLSLWFRKDDVLYVDNTLVNGAPGLWGAWTLDEKGSRAVYGTIPSKFKVEEILRRSMGSLDSEAQRRAVTTARRSFFRRKKHRDSKELASFSNTELGCWSDSGTLSDDAPILSYERVERLHYGTHRPVVIIGPLWECVVARLTAESPHVFGRVRAEPVAVAGAARALQRGTHLEPRPRRDSTHLDWIPLQAIRDMADKGIHCILDISVTSIEKLHKQLIYPIVLFIKFKSFKQIKEVKDTRYPADKVSAKAAKEMYEYGLKIENEYRSHISAEIPAGVNIAYMCTQVKEAVEDEQNKTLWVPAVQA